MDYDYIDRLLERYWKCETSLKEESELRTFFSKSDMPKRFLPYKDLFVYQQIQKTVGLGSDFDVRVLSKIEPPVVKAKRLTMFVRIKPFLRAAAAVALIVLCGNITERSYFADDKLDYNYKDYKDTFHDPEVAYKKVSSALMMLSEEIKKSKSQHFPDSLYQNDLDSVCTK
ncbi:MAG: hypothetical protein WCR45_00380 [Bacteroidaceae bacterium]|nr:hypothetical protein [Bacteroidaceae bacterium]